MSRRKSPNSNISKITDADLAFARRKAPEAIAYYRESGLREVRSRAVSIAMSGAPPLFGLAFLGWSTMAMLLYLVADAVITVVADLVKYPLARAWIAASHQRDHVAGQVMLVFDGLEDGTCERPSQGRDAPNPGVIMFFGVVSTLFLVPVIGAATDKIGLAPLRAALSEPTFPWFVGADAAWRILSSLVSALSVRRAKPGERMIFLESGGVAVLYAGLLCLIWLPLNWGAAGLMAMFIILYVFRLAFGIFALIWTPRAVRVMERRVREDDFSVKMKAAG